MFSSDTTNLGQFLIKIIVLNEEKTCNSKIFGPDETKSNCLGAVFHQFLGERCDGKNCMSSDGRVMEILSEKQCGG